MTLYLMIAYIYCACLALIFDDSYEFKVFLGSLMTVFAAVTLALNLAASGFMIFLLCINIACGLGIAAFAMVALLKK